MQVFIIRCACIRKEEAYDKKSSTAANKLSAAPPCALWKSIVKILLFTGYTLFVKNETTSLQIFKLPVKETFHQKQAVKLQLAVAQLMPPWYLVYNGVANIVFFF